MNENERNHERVSHFTQHISSVSISDDDKPTNGEERALDWSGATIGWYAIVIWFCANLLSQAVHLGIYGAPYDSHMLVAEFGPFAWILISVEIIFWLAFSASIAVKVTKRLSETNAPIDLKGKIAIEDRTLPQA